MTTFELTRFRNGLECLMDRHSLFRIDQTVGILAFNQGIKINIELDDVSRARLDMNSWLRGDNLSPWYPTEYPYQLLTTLSSISSLQLPGSRSGGRFRLRCDSYDSYNNLILTATWSLTRFEYTILQISPTPFGISVYATAYAIPSGVSRRSRTGAQLCVASYPDLVDLYGSPLFP